jgi:DNA (cytosine-5)-methyltransferase 1
MDEIARFLSATNSTDAGPVRFIDLFAGLGGFHRALLDLGHDCVFASEIDRELRELYLKNFPDAHGLVHGDIRECKDKVPPHDVLCAGFPCQPFSKSGGQQGLEDKTRGTLFHEIAAILETHRPPYVILENVGNFERHDSGRTWRIVSERLAALGYNIQGTTHVATGGPGLISPHHLGYPHTRERFFIVASTAPLPEDTLPRRGQPSTSLRELVQAETRLSPADRRETALTAQQTSCVHHWNELLARIPATIKLPSFPIWGDEILASYPYRGKIPFRCTAKELRPHLAHLLPPRGAVKRAFPRLKTTFIEQNREWFAEISQWLTIDWIAKLWRFPSSLRKLEWNCQGEERDLWRYALQFRPSGLRVKRYTSCPALVAMTSTQIPILGPEKRFITRVEGLRLQGFPDDHRLPASREKAFAALGNAVHVGVVSAVAQRLLSSAYETDA